MTKIDTAKILSFDLTATRDVVARKWWIIPLTMLIGSGLMFWQESDLRTTPSYFTLTRTYEPLDETSALSIVGIDTDSIGPSPSESNQLIILQSDEIKNQILGTISSSINVKVERTDKYFTFDTKTDDNGANRFSFRPSLSASYVFSCVEKSESNCSLALDSYLSALIKIRSESTKNGLQNSIQLVDSLLQSSDQLSELTRENLIVQKTALEKSVETASGSLSLVLESKYLGGNEISNVDTSTYIFGLLIGLMIGILILLQLIVSDEKIRSTKKLIDLVGDENFLGEISKQVKSSSIQHLASAIRGANTNGVSKLRLVPVGDHNSNIKLESQLAEILSVQVLLTESIANFDANALSPDSSILYILVVQKNSAKIADLRSTWAIIDRSGNQILGTVLVN